ncbi:MAG: hypothetical protein LBU67_06165 [Oscillospiraceae bacterium]|jgi:hypothetical protein|nr:hypothetical protein [Oscillospiraceae bacterium]
MRASGRIAHGTLFVLSGVALTLTLSLGYSLVGTLAGLALCLPVYALLAWRYRLPDAAARTGGLRPVWRALALAGAALCTFYFSLAFANDAAPRFPALTGGWFWAVVGGGFALSLYAAYVLLCALLRTALPVLGRFLGSLTTYEMLYWVLWTALVSACVLWVYHGSLAFDTPLYRDGMRHVSVPWNAVYSLDTPSLIGDFTAPGYAEIRHPLFSLLAFPVGLAARQWGKLVGAAAPYAQAALLAVAGAAMLGACAVLLARRVRSPWMLALYSLSHPVLVYALCVERYQLSVFLLIVTASAPAWDEGRARRYGPLIAAAGATATSVLLAPALADARRPLRWLREMALAALWALGMLAVLGRGGLLLDAPARVAALLAEHAAPMSLAERLAQYSRFVTACFAAIPYGVAQAPWPSLTWLPATGVDWVGVALFTLCALGLALNFRQRFARICGWWMGCSILLLPVLGWGAGEFPFFSFYFSWAAVSLAFLGICGLLAKTKALRAVALMLAVAALVWFNYPAIRDLLAFALRAYPRGW